jgi:hypothetical protein
MDISLARLDNINSSKNKAVSTYSNQNPTHKNVLKESEKEFW